MAQCYSIQGDKELQDIKNKENLQRKQFSENSALKLLKDELDSLKFTMKKSDVKLENLIMSNLE